MCVVLSQFSLALYPIFNSYNHWIGSLMCVRFLIPNNKWLRMFAKTFYLCSNIYWCSQCPNGLKILPANLLANCFKIKNYWRLMPKPSKNWSEGRIDTQSGITDQQIFKVDYFIYVPSYGVFYDDSESIFIFEIHLVDRTLL